MAFYTFGPQSPNASTTRPPTDRQVSYEDTWFKDCTGEALDGTQMTVSWANVITAQLNTVCRKLGIDPDPTNDQALYQAILASQTYVLPQANHVRLGGVELATDVLVTAGADETTAVTPKQANGRIVDNGCATPPFAGYDEIPLAVSAQISVDLSTYLGRGATSVTIVRAPTGAYSLAGMVLTYTAPATAGSDKLGFVGTNAHGPSNVGFINFTYS